ncbi:hypothetical protein [Povalibacter sp.]|uniref:hypothetical protein n=1 Tax=Povalibacter sp. TaxID=1962978 RepID=UPI002F3FC2AC
MGAKGGVIGRPRKLPPADAAQRIQQLAAEGCNKVNLAAQLGTSVKTFNEWLGADESLQLAFSVGRERERNELHQILLRDARDGEKPNVNAIFLLKARHAYREGDIGDDVAARFNVTINLPAAKPMGDFIDVTPEKA